MIRDAGMAAAAAMLVRPGKQTYAQEAEAVKSRVNTNSQPSKLMITDMRVVNVMNRWIIRLDTNQGLSGYGEVRDGSSPTYALMLKSRILGMNPCNVEKIFKKLKQFGNNGRQAGGVVSIEMACWDLAGKAWGVPCWQMLGGKYRDKIRVYADTPSDPDPAVMGKKLKQRIDMGFTFLKMDVSINLLKDVKGGVTYPAGAEPFGKIRKAVKGAQPAKEKAEERNSTDDFAFVKHPFTGIRITDKGLRHIKNYVAAVREIIGWEIPLATDHYGHFAIEDGIKLAQALDEFNLAWLEDMVPWQYTDQYVRLRNSCKTPILTGEDIYLKEGFRDLFDKKAISICHPDLATAGGLLETKRIGDLAMENGIAMVLHMAGNPVTLFSTVHCAAATENFLVMEHHNVESDWYNNIVTGVPKPIMGKDGFIPVPDGPGLGFVFNEDAVKAMLKDPSKEYFPPTPEWNNERSWDRDWSIGPSQSANRPA